MPQNNIDMLHGPLLGKIVKFAIPFAASSILEQMFVSIDVAVVGRFASSEALAAVGANTFLINLMINLFVGISLGANVQIAHHIGQHDRRGIRDAISTTSVLALVSGFFLLFLGLAIARPVLSLMGTPAGIMDDAVLFLRVYFLGMPFFMVYNFGASILRSNGDTKRPLYVLLIAGVINTSLNLLFVIVFHMSVAGVAMATGIANAFSASAVVWLLMHEPYPFRFSPKRMRVKKRELSHIIGIGVPAGIQGMVFSFSNVFVQSSINGYGAAAIAGAAISQMFDGYCYFLMSAFCAAAVTFVGQNYGAGQMDRCRRVFWICLCGGAMSCFVGDLLFLVFADPILSLFTGDAAVVEYAKERMFVVLLFQAVAAGYEIPASTMRGMNHSLEPALITIFGTCVLRLVWIFAVTPILPGYRNLMICYPASWILTAVLMIPAFILTVRKEAKALYSSSPLPNSSMQ